MALLSALAVAFCVACSHRCHRPFGGRLPFCQRHPCGRLCRVDHGLDGHRDVTALMSAVNPITDDDCIDDRRASFFARSWRCHAGSVMRIFLFIVLWLVIWLSTPMILHVLFSSY